VPLDENLCNMVKEIRSLHKKGGKEVGVILIADANGHTQEMLKYVDVYIPLKDATKETVHDAILEQVSILENGSSGHS